VSGGTVETVNGTGTISGGTFGVKSFASKKRDQEVDIFLVGKV